MRGQKQMNWSPQREQDPLKRGVRFVVECLIVWSFWTAILLGIAAGIGGLADKF
jgi:hypothetical protein